MGLASPRNIGIVAAIAVAAGLVPGVPGIVGGAPAEDAATALPPAPEVVDVVTSEPVGPDDGLIRLIVTPTTVVESEVEPPGVETSPEPVEAETGAEGTEPAATPTAGGEDEPAGPGGTGGPGDSEAGRPSVAGSDAEHVIDPDVLSQLTDGAVLHLDRRKRPWAVFTDGTRVPLFPAGDGASLLAERQRARERQSETEPERDGGGARVPGQPGADPVGAAPADEDPATAEAGTDVMAASGVGHPLMDEIAELAGVQRVVSLGDGSYAVTLEDPAVLDGFDVAVAEDIAMGIGSEPYERYQWALDNTGDNLNGIGANPTPTQRADADVDGVEARAAATGRGVVVAVIDSGVDFSHPDLAPARWTNDGEDCANGIDDDANGFVDDCHGWDFAYEDDSPYNAGAHAHGTHVAGIIAAAIDGQGVAGVAPRARIMDLNVGTITASGQPGITTSAVARAIRYATDNGADVINLSLGTSPGSPRAASAPVESAIMHAEANGVLVVAAAGNDGVSLDGGPGWPAGYEMSNMITVGASTPSDTRAGFSNWGRVVDIFAPGELILSTVPVTQGRWKFMSGTSQATPIVAAAAALLLDDVPGLPPAELRARLIAASDRHDSLMAHVADGVRLNAAAVVGVGSPEHRLADVAVRISGLSTTAAGAPVEAEIDIAVPAEFGGDDHFSWHASVFVSLPDGVAVLAGHEISVDGLPQESDEAGSVDLGIERSGTVTVATSLPDGAYALMLEAVPADDPAQRLGAPKVVTFTVGATETSPDGGPTPSTPTGPGSGPTGGGDSGGPGRGTAPGGTGDGTRSRSGTSGGSTTGSGIPTQGSGSGGSSSGSIDVGTDDGSRVGASTGSGSGGSSSATRPVVGGGGVSTGGGRSTTGGSTGGASTAGSVSFGGSASDSSGSGGASVVSQPPAPPGPVTSGTWAIEMISPHYAPVGVTSTVQLLGRFPSAAYVWFGEVPGSVLVASDRMMIVLAPAGAAAGTVDVSLRRSGEGTVLTVPGGFTYLGGSSSSGGGVGGVGTVPSAGGGTGGGEATAPGGGGGGDGDGMSGGTGGGEATAPGGGEAAAPGDTAGEGSSGSGSPPVGLDARQPRNRGGEVVDLGNGLRGVMVEGANPLAGAPRCAIDPCRF